MILHSGSSTPELSGWVADFKLLITEVMSRRVFCFSGNFGGSLHQRAKLVDWRILQNADKVWSANRLSYPLFSILFLIISSC